MNNHNIFNCVTLLSICISFGVCQDTLNIEMATRVSDSILVTGNVEVKPQGIKEVQTSPNELFNNFDPVSYKWTIKTNMGKIYSSCGFSRINGDTLIVEQKYGDRPVELIPLHLDSIKVVRIDHLPRMLTGVGGGCSGCFVGFGIAVNMSLSSTGTYENVEYMIPSMIGGIIIGQWALKKLFSKEYDLSAFNTEMKRMKLYEFKFGSI